MRNLSTLGGTELAAMLPKAERKGHMILWLSIANHDDLKYNGEICMVIGI